MPSQAESDFNSSVADIFIPEYERETGIATRLIACDREFPDLVLEQVSDGECLEVELVEVTFSFINQEQGELRRYEERMTEMAPRIRPSFKDKMIRLQMSEPAWAGLRPHAFPKVTSKEGAAIIAELEMLLKHCGEEILANWGGRLRDLIQRCGIPDLPMLTKHFDAMLINSIPEAYPGRLHPDDPVFELRNVTMYNGAEIAKAVQRAINAKQRKGPSYSADLLVLHTIKADHKPYVPGTGMHAEIIVGVGQILAPSLRRQFREVWFLNAYYSEGDGKRLYRLA
jgi:hypothetical protein